MQESKDEVVVKKRKEWANQKKEQRARKRKKDQDTREREILMEGLKLENQMLKSQIKDKDELINTTTFAVLQEVRKNSSHYNRLILSQQTDFYEKYSKFYSHLAYNVEFLQRVSPFFAAVAIEQEVTFNNEARRNGINHLFFLSYFL